MYVVLWPIQSFGSNSRIKAKKTRKRESKINESQNKKNGEHQTHCLNAAETTIETRNWKRIFPSRKIDYFFSCKTKANQFRQ